MAKKVDAELRERFVAARKRSGLTQSEAAAKLGVSEGTVSRKERGEQPVKERDATAMERLGEIVPRGTISVGEPEYHYGEPRRPLADILKGERALEWLLAFRRDMRAFAGPEAEERAVELVTSQRVLDLAEYVKREARKCRHCGATLTPAPSK